LPSIWDDHWGLAGRNGTAIIVGEWGGRNVGDDQVWQNALVSYMIQRNMSSFMWCLNPGSEDTGGLLKNDWKSLDEGKAALLRQSPSSKVGPNRWHFRRATANFFS
jgi:endoglucanase